MSGAAEISPPAPVHRAPPAPQPAVAPAPRLFGPPPPVQQRRVARTELCGDRQPFIDRPKLLRPKAPPLLAVCVEASVQAPRVVRPAALPVLGMATVQAEPPRVQRAPQLLVRYERIPLEHMRPLRDKHGNLVRDAEGRPRLVPK